MSLKRPRRHNYDSEPEFLLACLRYLDAKYPGREGQRRRMAAFRSWELEHDEPRLRRRIAELIEADEWTAADQDEWDSLTAAWKALRTDPRTTKEEAK